MLSKLPCDLSKQVFIVTSEKDMRRNQCVVNHSVRLNKHEEKSMLDLTHTGGQN